MPVRRQVDTLCAGLHAILGEQLAGVYLHGSLAMGCFNLQRSDIDLLAVTHTPIDVTAKRRLAELLLRTSADPRPIEISCLNLGDLHPWRYPTPYDFHYGEDGRERLQAQLASGDWPTWDQAQTDPDLAAHVTITLNRGVCLAGQAIDRVFPPVPRADYVASIVDDWHWAKERVASNPVYFILNTCRVLAYLRADRICSKEEGGVWALAVLPETFRPMVMQALGIYRDDRDAGRFDAAELAAFVAYSANEFAG